MTAFINTLLVLVTMALMQPSHMRILRVSPYTFNKLKGSCPDGNAFISAKANITTEVMSKLGGLLGINLQCGGDDGWMKVLDVNTSNSNANCPQGLSLYTNPFRVCGRPTTSTEYDSCDGTIISVGNTSYSKVCGRMKAYHQGRQYSFWGRNNIEMSYLDGISLTYGPAGSRQHIWSFVAGLDTAGAGSSYCPINGQGVPSFITNDYFCDSGAIPGDNSLGPTGVYTTRPLWDGVDGGCVGDPNVPPRCYVNNPPQFFKTLPTATSSDIELRLCGYDRSTYGDTLVEVMEVYIK